MLCGLSTQTSGHAKLWGCDLRGEDAHALHRRIGYMPQKFSLYRPLTVLQNLSFFAGLYGVPPGKISARIEDLMQTLDLSAHQHTIVGTLSLGILQKISFACALIHEPDLLFLDEPTSGVDPMTRKEFWKILLTVNKQGVSIVVTTHFMEEAQYCHNIVLMDKGQKIAMGSPFELYAYAKNHKASVQAMDQLFLWYLDNPAIEAI